MSYTTAIVREVPDTYDQCVTDFTTAPPIDVALAKEQHKNYCRTLQQLGLDVVKISADAALPDCCFVEDTAIVPGDFGIITIPGTASRLAEVVEMKKTLSSRMEIFEITSPATIEGGDVLRIKNKICIGLSSRTNEEGIKQVRQIVSPFGFEVIAVKIQNILHLKSACTYLGNNCLIYAEGFFDDEIFDDYSRIVVPKEESYCANCLEVNGTIIIPSGYPQSRKLIEEKGFPVIELEMSEFKKGEGSLTCLSVLL